MMVSWFFLFPPPSLSLGKERNGSKEVEEMLFNYFSPLSPFAVFPFLF